NIDPVFHLLSRAAWAPWPGDLERVKALGTSNWIEEQLAPEKIDDRACDLRARRFETLLIPPGACYDFKKQSLRLDIVRHTLLRAIYSKRQLFEVMVSFWTDHLNVSIDKGDCIYLKPSDDRLVVREHALGKFKDLIRSSALSPAMLVYLDGKENRKAGPNGVPNENYARELLELHTLGVHGGYSQHDVYELARCLTGWRLNDEWQRAKVYFDASNHDNGEKTLLGQTIKAGGGEKDIDDVVNIVCKHPSTARFISSKLAAKFINSPSKALVDQLAATFTRSDGDIKEILRQLLNSAEFDEDRGSKIKRPFHYVVSVCRALAADTHAHDDLIEYLQRMGQPPFQFPTPDGYPDEANYWLGNLLWRWKFAIAIATGELKNAQVNVDDLLASLGIKKNGDAELGKFFAYFAGRSPSHDELQALKIFTQNCPVDKNAHRAELAGLILSSPAFQRY
ncbi:MAG: DUF1800 domain-containing protein, partial [Candidatus Obscuribacterales bacterium]|nr:DUF1800 domain-containing protein [Candidatus Obscuribacterales bacterium]